MSKNQPFDTILKNALERSTIEEFYSELELSGVAKKVMISFIFLKLNEYADPKFNLSKMKVINLYIEKALTEDNTIYRPNLISDYLDNFNKISDIIKSIQKNSPRETFEDYFENFLKINRELSDSNPRLKERLIKIPGVYNLIYNYDASPSRREFAEDKERRISGVAKVAISDISSITYACSVADEKNASLKRFVQNPHIGQGQHPAEIYSKKANSTEATEPDHTIQKINDSVYRDIFSFRLNNSGQEYYKSHEELHPEPKIPSSTPNSPTAKKEHKRLMSPTYD